MSISQLPREVLNIILSYLPRDSYRAVVRVSRDFKYVAERFSYSVISVPRDCEDGRRTTLHRLSRLLRTLTENPRLCPYVVSLHLFDSAFCSARVIRLQHQLLGLLPALQELSFAAPPVSLDITKHSRLTALRLDFSFRSMPLSYNLNDPDYYWPIISRLVRVPSLRRLELKFAYLCYFRQSIGLNSTDGHKLSSITDLRLTCGDVLIPSTVERLLLSFEALQSFAVEFDMPAGRSRFFTPDEEIASYIFRGLEPHVGKLTELTIVGIHPQYSPSATPSSLSKFTRLKRLAIPAGFLRYRDLHDCDCCSHTGDNLPECLEELQLQHRPGPDIIQRNEITYGLCAGKEEKLVGLRSVVYWIMDGVINNECTRVRFANVDVDFEWVFGGSFNETPFGKNRVS
ncbi:hypothetical protein MMC13_005048 [Lambiella insularis]|nr:hypothetical protein [Lambiella insularis]